MKSVLISAVLALGVLGCEAQTASPPTVQTTSKPQIALSERVRFLEQYISFRRTYKKLEYNVQFFNGDGLVPSPSEWDIKLLAVVPTDEIQDWIPKNIEPSEAPPPWLSDIPGEIPIGGINEWYQDGQRTIGVDHSNGIIAYRNFAM